MKKSTKRILALFMCVVILFFSMGNALAPKAEAANPALAIEGVSLIVWILGLLGITFATTAEQYKTSQQLYNDIPELKSWVDSNTQYVNPSTAQMNIPKNGLATLVQDVILKVKAHFTKNNYALKLPRANSFTYYGNVPYTTKVFSNNVQAFQEARYSFNKNNYNVTCIYNGVTYNYNLKAEYDTNNKITNYMLTRNGGQVWGFNTDGAGTRVMTTSGAKVAYDAKADFLSFVDVRYGFMLQAIGGINYLVPYFAYAWQDKNGIVRYIANYSGVSFKTDAIPYDSTLSSPETETVKSNTAIDYSDAELVQAIKSIADALPADGSLSIPLDDPNWDATHGKTEVENPDTAVPAVPTTNWAEIWEALGIKDLIKTLTQNKTTTLEESDFKAPQLPTGIADKFPFCVPFDMIALVKVFYATPQAPVFNIPVQFKEFNYSNTFTFDFSGDSWNKIALVIRWGMTIFFLLGLTVVTRKMIKG